MVAEVNDNSSWDAVCIQEGLRGVEGGLQMETGCWILKSKAGQRGSNMIVLHPRLGRRIRRWALGDDFAVCELAMCPPLIIATWHAPSVTAGQEAFDQSLSHLQSELEYLRGKHAQSTRLVVCGDLNCQLVAHDPLIGQFGCAIERPSDAARACSLHGALFSDDLKVHSSFHNLGPTRHPWPQAAKKGEKPTIIDFACASSKLQARVFIPEKFPTVTRSDHIPTSIHLLAPKHDKRRRAKLMEGVLRKPAGHLSATWAPRNADDFKREIQGLQPEGLQQFATNVVEVARRHTQYNNQKDPVRSELLKGLREAGDPTTRRAYQIHLRAHLREQR